MQFSKREHTWAKLAAFLRYAELLAGWTRQWWAFGISVESRAGEATIVAVALDALLRWDSLAVIVNYAVQVTLSCEHEWRDKYRETRDGSGRPNAKHATSTNQSVACVKVDSRESDIVLDYLRELSSQEFIRYSKDKNMEYEIN